MFSISQKILSSDELLRMRQDFNDPSIGGVVTFEGVVRNHNENQEVASLEYMAYESMALKVGKKIVETALGKFPITNAFCIHRVGHLKIGEVAVWVLVSASHRQEAFLACEYIINEIKKEVPIWKREHYVHKAPDWVACHRCGSDNHV